MKNKRAEWMWRLSDEDIYLRMAKKQTFMCFCFVLIYCRNMIQTSERTEPSERAEQIWSGWSKFGVGGTHLEWVEQIWSGWSGCGQNSVESS